MDAFPIPTATPSHLDDLFVRMYGSFSRDAEQSDLIQWSIGGGKTAYLLVSGVTATLFTSDGTTDKEYTYNLAIQDTSTRPTVANLVTWIAAQDSSITISVIDSTTNSLSALVIPEDIYIAPTKITRATSINYLQMRLVALLFDLMSADTANMFLHLSLGGLEGMWLNWVGSFYGVKRISNEDDTQYKRRLLETLAQPQESNIAIASLVSQAFGVAEVIAQDYKLFWCILYVFGSLPNPNLVMPFVRSVAPAGIIWTGIEIPPGGSLSGAVAGYTRAGTYSDVRFRRPPRWGVDTGGRGRWYDAVSTPLSGEFAILH